MANRKPERGIAQHVDKACRTAFGVPFPLGIRVWDGSALVRADRPTVVVRSPRAIRHVLRQPGELGLVRAYVAGHVDIDGDLSLALDILFDFVRAVREARLPRLRGVGQVLRALLRLGALGVPPAVPVEEARLSGRRHTRARDRAAIAHHYDLGNDFYASILDETMAYSCGYWEPGMPEGTSGRAQLAKLDLICRKLNLLPGNRLLDVGCGWGALVLHAAEHYGVRATGVTVSTEQRDFVRAAAVERGLDGRVDVRLLDYRDAPEERFDAISSVEMGEHVGEGNYETYCVSMRDRLRPGGRLLLQQMSRGDRAPGGGAFIESYIAPDMTMRPLHRTLAYLEGTGLEVRDVMSMREHYVLTVNAWARRLDDVWHEVVHRYGARRARIWRLYLAGVARAFERNRMSVHQILAVRGHAGGASGMPLRPAWLAAEGASA